MLLTGAMPTYAEEDRQRPVYPLSVSIGGVFFARTPIAGVFSFHVIPPTPHFPVTESTYLGFAPGFYAGASGGSASIGDISGKTSRMYEVEFSISGIIFLNDSRRVFLKLQLGPVWSQEHSLGAILDSQWGAATRAGLGLSGNSWSILERPFFITPSFGFRVNTNSLYYDLQLGFDWVL